MLCETSKRIKLTRSAQTIGSIESKCNKIVVGKYEYDITYNNVWLDESDKTVEFIGIRPAVSVKDMVTNEVVMFDPNDVAYMTFCATANEFVMFDGHRKIMMQSIRTVDVREANDFLDRHEFRWFRVTSKALAEEVTYKIAPTVPEAAPKRALNHKEEMMYRYLRDSFLELQFFTQDRKWEDSSNDITRIFWYAGEMRLIRRVVQPVELSYRYLVSYDDEFPDGMKTTTYSITQFLKEDEVDAFVNRMYNGRNPKYEKLEKTRKSYQQPEEIIVVMHHQPT